MLSTVTNTCLVRCKVTHRWWTSRGSGGCQAWAGRRRRWPPGRYRSWGGRRRRRLLPLGGRTAQRRPWRLRRRWQSRDPRRSGGAASSWPWSRGVGRYRCTGRTCRRLRRRRRRLGRPSWGCWRRRVPWSPWRRRTLPQRPPAAGGGVPRRKGTSWRLERPARVVERRTNWSCCWWWSSWLRRLLHWRWWQGSAGCDGTADGTWAACYQWWTCSSRTARRQDTRATTDLTSLLITHDNGRKPNLKNVTPRYALVKAFMARVYVKGVRTAGYRRWVTP